MVTRVYRWVCAWAARQTPLSVFCLLGRGHEWIGTGWAQSMTCLRCGKQTQGFVSKKEAA